MGGAVGGWGGTYRGFQVCGVAGERMSFDGVVGGANAGANALFGGVGILRSAELC